MGEGTRAMKIEGQGNIKRVRAIGRKRERYAVRGR